jgi:hypothetical protein
MDDLRDRVQSGQTGTLAGILNAIPGYGGYRDKQLRRDADRLLREHIVIELSEQSRKFAGLQRDLIDAGQLRLVDDLERVARRLEALTDRIRHAARGYAGFFDAVQIREEELSRLYEFDETLLAEIPHIGEGLSELGTSMSSQAGVAEAIRDLGEAVDRLADYWRRRREVVLQN